MLKKQADGENPNTNNDDDNERFKEVLKKPSGLVNAPKSTKNYELSILDKLEDLSSDDVMNLTDKQIKALEKAMLEEEMKG